MQFNARAIATQVGASLIATKIQSGLQGLGVNPDSLTGQAIINSASSATHAVVGGLATHTPITIQQIAANAVSGTVGENVGER